MSTPPHQQPYQPPYQPQYQAAPPYGYPRPRPTHTGKLVGAILLFVAGPILGLSVVGIGFAVVAVNTATDGDVISNGQRITLSAGDERTLYVEDGELVDICSITSSEGKDIATTRSTGTRITTEGSAYHSVLKFTATTSGEYRVSCDGLGDDDPIRMIPEPTLGMFTWPLVAGLGVGSACWMIAIILLVRRHQALAAQNQAG